jgi:predicted ArsR family transcriptional regulator
MAPRTRSDDLDESLAKVAALGDPVRRALYRYVVAQPNPVRRTEAADALGIAQHSAKFHLDRLETDGLLDAEYARPPGKDGPGAGRPAKRYRRPKGETVVSLPARRYDLVGHVMAEAISTATGSGVPIAQSLRRAAAAAGRRLGDAAQARIGRHRGKTASIQAVTDVLTDCGYEPRVSGGAIILANCPFHSLAEDYTELICGMNLDLLNGLATTCGRAGLHPELDPDQGRCCVTIGLGG